jgi:dTDP-4-amino-4,6-dideoxygalactose transaminase
VLRRQLPVYSPIPAGALAAGFMAALGGEADEARAHVRSLLAARFSATDVLLTDSGTSALSLAIAASIGDTGRSVALPGYACYDVATAAVGAGAHACLYDVDPRTLGPDVSSLKAVCAERPAAVVLVHPYGYPVDMPALGLGEDAVVIEDAAQGHGGSLRGRPLGSFGHVSVLSFGRGKGMTGGGGGALLAHDERGAAVVARARRSLGKSAGELRTMVTTAAQFLLGRPSLYAIPSSLPFLHLGQTNYRTPSAPRDATDISMVLLDRARPEADRETEIRQRNARRLAVALTRSPWLRAIEEVAGAQPGFLRFPARVTDPRWFSDHSAELGREGIVGGYPTTLADIPGGPWSRSLADLPGAAELARTLVTVPTHSLVSDDDLARIESWVVRPR